MTSKARVVETRVEQLTTTQQRTDALNLFTAALFRRWNVDRALTQQAVEADFLDPQALVFGLIACKPGNQPLVVGSIVGRRLTDLSLPESERGQVLAQLNVQDAPRVLHVGGVAMTARYQDCHRTRHLHEALFATARSKGFTHAVGQVLAPPISRQVRHSSTWMRLNGVGWRLLEQPVSQRRFDSARICWAHISGLTP